MLGKATEIVTAMAWAGQDYIQKRYVNLDEAINVVLMDLGETEVISIHPLAASYTDGDGNIAIEHTALITCRIKPKGEVQS
ncbi:hypothetical protein [Paenibacillus durus]|uniref:Uncharacterized protein n=1 Tax=Paenibacillus durus ATCC 35681 TaxID=1333534 RepID=A0A0F7FBG0_PAEDU|nr:hypothetical protein [Paenibacillus durus]AKG36112.1 hypothetical protein VK70_17385 [Paenibacillus durus ATCC 35681]